MVRFGRFGAKEEQMETVTVTIIGATPLLMHADSIEWADKMEAWKNDADNKAKSKAGDDRTPPWRWLGCLNFDSWTDGIVTIPSEYIMRSIMGGAAQVPTGKKQGTYKALSQSGLLCEQMHWPLLVNGVPIQMRDVTKCQGFKTFAENVQCSEALGFSLFMKRAKIGQSKHIRVRPRFDNWSISGNILITDEQITPTVLQKILDIAGRTKGLGDWRPGAPTPGPFGMYKAVLS